MGLPSAQPGSSAAAVGRARLVGVDLARLLALLGMFTAHLRSPWAAGDPDQVDALFQVVAGRSAALFAVLAGVSIALLARRPGARHRSRLLVRALVVTVIGLVLGLLDSGVAVILVYYGVLFCCALPVLRWRASSLAWLALGWALLSPVASLLLRPVLPPTTYAVPSLEDLVRPPGLLAELLVTGYYPVLTWAAYLFAGLAVGRLLAPPDRSLDPVVPHRALRLLLLPGAWLGALTLAVSAVVTRSERVRAALVEDAFAPSWAALATELRRGFYGTHPEGSPWWLAVWAPHSGSVVDLLHTTGTALLLLGLCLWLVQLTPALPWRILSGAGAMTLTLYSLHVVVLSTPLGEEGLLARGTTTGLPLQAALAVLIGAVVAALGRRGPLERLVAALVDTVPPARHR